MTSFEDSFFVAEREAFRFLVAEHGFRLRTRRVGQGKSPYGVFGQVVYEVAASSRDLGRVVSLYTAPLRLKLSLQISRGTSGPFHVEELHALDGNGPFPPREYGLYDAMHNPQELLAELTRLSDALRASGARFFNDEPALWDELDAQRESRAEINGIKSTLALAKSSFHARDWPRVVSLLSPIEACLGSMASARLMYARRKTRGGV